MKLDPPYLIDTHCHLDAPEFNLDREVILQTLANDGVSTLVVPAVDAEGWPFLHALGQTYRSVQTAFGLHPIYLAKHQAEHIQLLRAYLEQGTAVAVGECGLDFFVPALDPEQQVYYFLAQLKLAKEFDLPVIIHARRSVDQVIKYVRQVGDLRGVVHSFAGSEQQAEMLVKLGLYFGLGGTVTYERAQRLRRIVTQLPAELLLLETDAPDQPDNCWRGQRNEPKRLAYIAQTVAELRGVPYAQLAELTTCNAKHLFRLTE